MSKPVFPSLNDNALKVLEKRNYLWHKPDGQRETVDEMFRRVARFIASAENKFKVANSRYSAAEFEEIAFRLMRGLKFIPNTPTIVNAGRPNGQLAACYVLPLEDSMEGIMDTLKAQALVQKSGGGTGFSFSCIREKDSYIKSTGMKAVGPIPVIKLMNYLMTNFIIQGGVRHGANLGTLPVDHPDIEEFITFKDKDGSCASFNVSVGATDEFMQAVLDDGEITLVSRVGGHDKKKRARDIFDLIATYAWRTGDPGLLFLDTIERFNPTPHLGKLEATNPCVSGETLIATENGLLPIIDIVRRKAATHIIGPTGESEKITDYLDSGVKKVYKVTTHHGYAVRATDNHRWPVGDMMKRTDELVEGDVVSLQPAVTFVQDQTKFEMGELLGWLIGDGYLSHLETKSMMAGLIIGGPDKEYQGHLEYLLKQFTGSAGKAYVREEFNTTQILSSDLWRWAVKTLGIIPHKAGDKEVPAVVSQGHMSTMAGFLRGLFSADGHVINSVSNGSYGVRLTSKSETLIEGVQVLLAQFGITSTKYDRSRAPRDSLFKHTLQDGSITSYGSDGVCFEAAITGTDLHTFAKMIGFTQKYKSDKLALVLTHNLSPSKKTTTITSIMLDGEEETFCLTIEPSHRMCANGVIISNCGEQALLPNEACTLGHFNLAQYVHNGEFDFVSFESDIEYGVRFLDNVIEVNSYALPVIEKMHRDTNRKIGLGVMGFADALIMMGISYGSSKARELGGRIARALRLGADAASEALGVERGSFGAFVGSEVEKSWTHMRNACRTTVAPTGTTGMIAGVSTGIEPVFSFGLKREQAGMIMYEWHPLFEAWLESKDEETQASINSYYDKHGSLVGCQYIDGDEERIFIQANDVKYRDHVEMQAVWQKHIDNAISKTINLANIATVQDIKDAYILAWKSGCKGITVYRDGCRAHQALSSAGSSTMAGSLTGAVQAQWASLAGSSTSTSSPVYTNLHGVTFTSTHTNPVTASDQSASAAANALSVSTGISGGFTKMLQGTTQSGIETVGYNHVQDMVTVDEDKDCPECKAPALENSGGCSTCRGCGYSVCSI